MFRKVLSAYELFGCSDAVASFADANAPVWAEYQDQTGDGWVVVDLALTYHKALISAGVSGNYLRSLADANLLGVLDYRFNREATTVANSYGFDSLTFLSEQKRRPSTYLQAYRDAMSLYRQVSNPEELLSLEYDGIRIGDLVYNTYLRHTGAGTVSSIHRGLFPYLLDTIRLKLVAERLFDIYPPVVYLSSDILYSRSGILTRVASDRGASVYLTVRSQVCNVRIRDRERLSRTALRPVPEVFERVYEAYESQLVELGDKYISDRMNANISEMSATKAYNTTKRVIDRPTFFEEAPLDPEKPTVVVMSHVYNDAPVQGDNQLFRDYQVWLEAVLSFAVEHPEVNWVIKEHPRVDDYDCQTTVNDLIADATEDTESHSIYELPEDINTASISDIADVVTTVRGTAGVEFAATGIPTVTAGLSRYSGFGITHEPATRTAYFDLLSKPETLSQPREDTQRRAKAMMAFQQHCLTVSSELVPDWKAYETEADIWEAAREAVTEYHPESVRSFELLQKLYEEEMPHVVDTDSLWVLLAD